MSAVLRILLGEYDTLWHDVPGSLRGAATVVEAAARARASLVVLPEMCTTGFTMDASRAEPVDGPGVSGLRQLAKTSAIHLIAGVALRERDADARRAVNAALLIGPDGTVRQLYRKQRVFTYAAEHDSYAAGTQPVVAEVCGVRIGMFICYDLRFPELFRTVASGVDLLVIIANWPTPRRAHWDALLRARAIENQCYVVGVNRIGTGGGLVYDGGSAAFDPWGERCDAVMEGVRCVDVDADRVQAVRAEFPFLRDMRG